MQVSHKCTQLWEEQKKARKFWNALTPMSLIPWVETHEFAYPGVSRALHCQRLHVLGIWIFFLQGYQQQLFPNAQVGRETSFALNIFIRNFTILRHLDLSTETRDLEGMMLIVAQLVEHTNEPSAKVQNQVNDIQSSWQHTLGQVFSDLVFCSYFNHEARKQEFSLLKHTALFIHNKKYLCLFKSSLVLIRMPPEMDSESIPGAQNSSCTAQGKQTLYIFKSSLLEFILVFLRSAASKQSLTHLFLQQIQNKPSE